MYKLSTLTGKMPVIQQVKIINSGFAIWLVWNGKLSGAVSQTLLDHGCRLVIENTCRAPWSGRLGGIRCTTCPSDTSIRRID